MHAYLHCLSHSPLVGYVDPAQEVLDEVNGVIASARERICNQVNHLIPTRVLVKGGEITCKILK